MRIVRHVGNKAAILKVKAGDITMTDFYLFTHWRVRVLSQLPEMKLLNVEIALVTVKFLVIR
jgi:hypothetical protein